MCFTHIIIDMFLSKRMLVIITVSLMRLLFSIVIDFSSKAETEIFRYL